MCYRGDFTKLRKGLTALRNLSSAEVACIAFAAFPFSLEIAKPSAGLWELFFSAFIRVVRKFSSKLLFFLPKHSRTRLPLPGSDACGRIIFGLLSHVTDDKYATLAQNVDLRVLAPRVGTVPLQDKPHRLHVHFANGLWYRVSVLIL